MDTPVKIRLIVPALILGASLVGATFVVANAFYKVKALSRTISVTGTAERFVQSDAAKWRCRFSRNVGPDELATGSAQLGKDLAAVKSFFIAQGIAETEISVQPSTVSANCVGTQYYYERQTSCSSGQLGGYVLTQEMVVESSDVAKVKSVSEAAAGTLVAKGVIFSSDAPEYYYSKFSDIKLEMVAEATKNAKDRAEQIVGSVGGKLGPVQSASTGVFQVTAVNSMEVSDYGAYDTTTPDKKVTAVVRAAFALE